MRRDCLLIFDFGERPPADGDYGPWWSGEAFRTERDVCRALKRLGWQVRLLGLHDDIQPLIDVVRTGQPAFVFNLCEAYGAQRAHEPHVTAVLDLLGVPYTGAPTAALQLCKDKGLTKKILAFDGIRVPRFLISTRQRPLSDFTGFAFPAIVKPLDGEGSEGISQRSLVRHPFACASRVKELHRLTGGDVIIEEFIEGREIYAAVLGDDEVEVMPPREFRFARVAEGKPRIATFKAKWDDRYRRKWGLGTAPARGLGEGVEARVEGAARAVYKAFQIKGYARVDFRLDREGVPVFLEANPNPAIGSSEDFAKAARKAGVAYDDLIARIVGMTLAKSSKRAV